MDRRSALISTLMLGGFLPRVLRAQQGSQRGFRPVRQRFGDEPSLDPQDDRFNRTPINSTQTSEPFRPPNEFYNEGFPKGHRWKVYPIDSYTQLPHSRETVRPESAMVEWIFRYTGSDPWHGEELAALYVTPQELRAFHRPELIAQVDEVMTRFLKPWFDLLTIRVRIVASEDLNWRASIFSTLDPIRLSDQAYGGPQGQQAWTTDPDTATELLARMTVTNRFRTIHDERFDVVNGQTVIVRDRFKDPERYIAGLERANLAALGYEQRVEALEEGVLLRISPLLHQDPTTLDIAVDLRGTTVRRKHPTRVIVPRQIDPGEMTIQVPEVAQTRLNQTISDWRLDQTLIITGGILPGILASKTGALGIPINTPTELLVFLDARSNFESARRPGSRR